MSLVLLTLFLSLSFPVVSTQPCDNSTNTKCGDACHCANRGDCGGSACTGSPLCEDGWAGIYCTAPCQSDSATRCGGDCHCFNKVFCGSIDCVEGCDPGWEGKTCQAAAAASCSEGKYGANCDMNCTCPNRQTPACNMTTGQCTAPCTPGYTGPDCLPVVPCTVGRYGSNCDQTCNCPNRQTQACDRDSGVCTAPCTVGRYGSNCDQTCNCPNRQTQACDRISGVCTDLCIPGFTGSNCQTAVSCTVGRYGSNCELTCTCQNRQTQACDRDSGVCTAPCITGYTGPNCQTVVSCSVGRYGSNCDQTCNCTNRQTLACNKESGVCTGSCSTAYEGPNCQTPVSCSVGRYGSDCKQNCNCPNRQTSACDRDSGVCTARCISGFTGTNCQPLTVVPCEVGRYGSDCDQTCNCPNRQTQACGRDSGVCTALCIIGYTGTNCQTVASCTVGRYGKNCDQTCTCPNRQTRDCDETTGQCTAECITGYTGSDCQTVGNLAATEEPDVAAIEEPDVASLTGAVVGGVLGAVALLIAVVTILLVRKRRRRQNDPESGSPTPNTRNLRSSKKKKNWRKTSMILSKIITLTDLVRIVKGLDFDPDCLEDDFTEIPGGTNQTSDTASLPQHNQKCRYRGMVPYDHSRVVLEPRDSDPYSDFINASYIDGYSVPKKYIAAQGPTAYILNDFWRMIWQVNADVVVMLTKLKEGIKVKCDLYWPDLENVMYGHITVGILATHQFDDFCVRTLAVQAEGKVRTIKHFHFTQWGDHDAPADTTGIISLLTRVQEAKDEAKGPIVVHCSAGVGRTGTYIALDNLLEQARDVGTVDIPKCVMTIRGQRANMVQTQGQYAFLHRALRDAWLGADSVLTSPEFTQRAGTFFQPVPPSNKSTVETEFEALEDLRTERTDEDYKTAREEKNSGKNRDADNLALDNSRVFLSTYVSGRTDYINAVFMPGYKNKFAYISTQMPLSDTMIDFWRLVHEQKSSTIIMVNSGEVDADAQYWPADDEKMNLGAFEIQHQDTNLDGNTLLKQFRLTYLKSAKQATQVVRQFCVNLWKPGSTIPSSPARVLQLIKSVQEWQRQNDNRPIIIQCSNGVDKSALLCACFSVIEKLKAEHIISILYTVKSMRTHRPRAFPSVEQYRFCYELVQAYLEGFDTYANFTE